jgi:hypothetical protein
MSSSHLLEDRAEIADLIHRYARCVRHREFEGCRALFTEDGIFATREGDFGPPGDLGEFRQVQGHDAIVAHLGRSASASGGICPMIHNILIEVRRPEAASNCVMTGIVLGSGASVLGEYHDSFRRDDRWRFTMRCYTLVRAPAQAGSR